MVLPDAGWAPSSSSGLAPDSGWASRRREGLAEAMEASQSSAEAHVFARADPPYEITAVNAAWTQLCGWSAEEAVGLTCRILQGPETSRETLHCVHEAIRDRRKIAVRLLNYTKRGEPFLNDLTLEPLVSDAAGGDMAHGMASDDGASHQPPRVTHYIGRLRPWRQPQPHRPQARDPQAFETPDEATLSRQIRQSLPRNLAEALHVTDVSQIITEAASPFRIVHVNQAWCDTCGFTAEAAVGQTCSILQGPHTCKATLQALKAAALARQPLTVKLINYTKVSPCKLAIAFCAFPDSGPLSPLGSPPLNAFLKRFPS